MSQVVFCIGKPPCEAADLAQEVVASSSIRHLAIASFRECFFRFVVLPHLHACEGKEVSALWAVLGLENVIAAIGLVALVVTEGEEVDV